jgi:peptide/nickel transport system permease protein
MLLLKNFLKQPQAVVGTVVLIFLFFVGLFAPVIAPYSPYSINTDASFNSPPSDIHPLGVDQIGRDIFSRLIYASRVSLLVGFCATALGVAIGMLLGLFAGYYQGIFDLTVMRLADIFMSFSRLLVSLVVISIVGGSLLAIILLLGLLGWPQVSRLVRGAVLVEKKKLYVAAGFAMGYKDLRIMLNHIFPNIIGPIIIHATFSVSSCIMLEASLSFLGMGIQPPISSWGNMLNTAQSLSVLMNQPWVWVPPGLLIFITILSIDSIGEGLKDALDPQKIQTLK